MKKPTPANPPAPESAQPTPANPPAPESAQSATSYAAAPPTATDSTPVSLVPKNHPLYKYVRLMQKATGLDEPSALMCLLSVVNAYVGPNAVFELSPYFIVTNRLFWVFTSDDPAALQIAQNIAFGPLRRHVKSIMALRAELGASWQREVKKLNEIVEAATAGTPEDSDGRVTDYQFKSEHLKWAKERRLVLNAHLQEPSLAEPLKWEQWVKSTRAGYGSGIVSLDLDGKSLESLILMPLLTKRPLAQTLVTQLAGQLSFLGATIDKFHLPLPASWHFFTRPHVLTSLLFDTVLREQGLTHKVLPIMCKPAGPSLPLNAQELDTLRGFDHRGTDLRATRYVMGEGWTCRPHLELLAHLVQISQPSSDPNPPDGSDDPYESAVELPKYVFDPEPPDDPIEFAVDRITQIAQITLLIHAASCSSPLHSPDVGLDSWTIATKLFEHLVHEAQASQPLEAPLTQSTIGPDAELLAKIVKMLHEGTLFRAREVQRRFHRLPIAEVNRLLQILVDEELVETKYGDFHLVVRTEQPPAGDFRLPIWIKKSYLRPNNPSHSSIYHYSY